MAEVILYNAGSEATCKYQAQCGLMWRYERHNLAY